MRVCACVCVCLRVWRKENSPSIRPTYASMHKKIFSKVGLQKQMFYQQKNCTTHIVGTINSDTAFSVCEKQTGEIETKYQTNKNDGRRKESHLTVFRYLFISSLVRTDPLPNDRGPGGHRMYVCVVDVSGGMCFALGLWLCRWCFGDFGWVVCSAKLSWRIRCAGHAPGVGKCWEQGFGPTLQKKI